MKCLSVALLALLSTAALADSPESPVKKDSAESPVKKDSPESPVKKDSPESPVKKVLVFIQELKAEVEADAAKENASFSKFLTWYNTTEAATSKNIADSEASIENYIRRIEELSGFQAAGGAEIAASEKNLAENKVRQKEAAAHREKEAKEFKASKTEMDESVTALKDSLAEFGVTEDTKVTDNAEGFLQKRTSLTPSPRWSAAVRRLLQRVSGRVSTDDLQVLTSFAAASKTSRTEGLALLSLSEDPAGGAAAQVVSIIKTTKEDFEKDLSELEAEEAEKTKVHGELMATLQKEQADLQTFLTQQNSNRGDSVKELSDAKVLRDETELQLKADRALLTSTQDTRKEKTHQFDERSKLRAQELAGINAALEILSNEQATATFDGAAAVNFVQLDRARAVEGESAVEAKRKKASKIIGDIASKSHNLALARLAVQMTSDGSFDKVIRTIDTQIKHLRTEEQEDIKHRDRCKQQLAQSSSDLASVQDAIAKVDTAIARMESKEQEMTTALDVVSADINATKVDIADRSQEREEESQEHIEALKHDVDALKMVQDATEQITKFFKKQKVDVGAFVQVAQNPSAPAPDAGFQDANYQGAKDSTKGLVGMLELVEEDLKAEVESGKAAEDKNQALYEKDAKRLKELLSAQVAKELSIQKTLSALQTDIQAKKELKDDQTVEQISAKENKENLNGDCAWVKTNFESRRDNRKAEVDGLVEAKGILMGTTV